MRIITLNVNGIRSAERKGFARWLARAEPWDVVCLQEIKATHDDIPRALRAPRTSHAAFLPAERKGYTGVALYAKRAAAHRRRASAAASSTPRAATSKPHFAELTVDQRVPAVGLERAAPAGVEVPLPRRVPAAPREAAQARSARSSCAATGTSRTSEIDLKNWRSNQKNSGFLPEERAWLTRVFDELGFVDVFRRVDPRPEQYTWWSNRGQAWAKNVGWRIDYQIATPGIAAQGDGGGDLHEPALLRPRAADHRLRLRADGRSAGRLIAPCCASPTSPSPAARKRLLEGANLTVHAGHKVGLVGAERLRQVEPVRADPRRAATRTPASVELPAAWTIAHVAQETPAVARAGDRVRAGRRPRAARRSSARSRRPRRPPPPIPNARAKRSPQLHHRFDDDRRLRGARARRDAARRARASRRAATAIRSRASPAAGGCGSISRRR